MPWLPYDNDDLCVGSIQYIFCTCCGSMLTHAAEYCMEGEPLCRECYEQLCPGELLKFSMRSGVPIKSLSSFDER